MNQATPTKLSATQLLNTVFDAGSFVSWDTAANEPDLGTAYAAQLALARERSGVDESVLTGRAAVRGRAVAVIASEFSFLAGSVGQAAAERIVAAVERATREGLPLLASPASGGTRMQEGTPAFLSMISITDAVRRHKQAGLPYLVYLRHPTTGGAMASWGSLGHVTAAEPGALLGFLGPRVYELLAGTAFAQGVQVAENLLRLGIVDAVLPPTDLAEFVDKALRILQPQADASEIPVGEAFDDDLLTQDVWESITRSRDVRRPGGRAVIEAADESLVLNGTGQGENEAGIIIALARFGAQSCLVIAHDHSSDAATPTFGPASLREAQRGMRLAEELNLPVVTLIDTPGAELSKEAEEGAISGEIARSLNALLGTHSPSVSVLLGQGNGGGAIALLPADRTIAAENAWLSPLPPEGASAILYRTTEFAAQMAKEQQVSMRHLREMGLVDAVVTERQDAGAHSAEFISRVATAIEREIAIALKIPDVDRVSRRSSKFRALYRAPRLAGRAA